MFRSTLSDVSTFNAGASRALGAMLKAPGLIASISTQLEELRTWCVSHNRQCDEDTAATVKLLAPMRANVSIMGVVLNLIPCCASDASATSVALAQTGVVPDGRCNSSDESWSIADIVSVARAWSCCRTTSSSLC